MKELDIWSRWLCKERFGGNQEQMQRMLGFLSPIRDRVLEHAGLQEGQVLLDVGCGDGLIAFGALQRVPTCRVIFSDISQDLLDIAAGIAAEQQLTARCEFLKAPASNLTAIESSSVDAVTTRSVLIYEAGKQQAFNEFHRVLKPGGRISLFEPINRLTFKEPPNQFCGYDVAPVAQLAARLEALYERLQPEGIDPMVDFDERDLLNMAEAAGFPKIDLHLHHAIKPTVSAVPWEVWLHSAPNPKVPTWGEAIAQVMAPEEAERFSAHLRPLVESGQGRTRSAFAYLWAVK